MAEVGPCISKITLNLNDINTPIERQRIAEWIKSMTHLIGKPQETQFKYKQQKDRKSYTI